MNIPRKVIIDCDPGIDDSLALMLALSSPELEILGITIVCGNVPVDIGGENALKVLEVMNCLKIPVYLGAEKPLINPLITAQDTHGLDGLGENNYERVSNAHINDGAVDFIINTLKATPQTSIIALGPLTNIAKALERDPKSFENLDEFVTMGGSFKSHGNCSPVAEFNYWVDPHGANFVYSKLKRKIHMVGLDVTRKIILTPNILELISRFNTPQGLFINQITRFYLDFHWTQERIIGCVINDPLAVAYFINRELCSGFDSYTTIETESISTGQSVVDSMNFWKKEHNSHVLTDVDANGFMIFFLSRIFPEHQMIIREQLGGTKL